MNRKILLNSRVVIKIFLIIGLCVLLTNSIQLDNNGGNEIL